VPKDAVFAHVVTVLPEEKNIVRSPRSIAHMSPIDNALKVVFVITQGKENKE